MNPSAFEIPSLLMATVTLTVSAIVALIILRWLKPSSHRIHRAVWIAVLLNGIVLTRVSIDLPVLDQDLIENQTSLLTSNSESNFNDNAIESADESIERESFETSKTTAVSANNLPEDVVSNSLPAKVKSSMPEPGMHAATPNINWPLIAVVVWLTGMFFTFSVFVLRYVLFLRTLKFSVPAANEWTKLNESVSQDMKIGKTIPLHVHPTIGPALVATPRGYRILVPRMFWQNLSAEQRNCVLKHEYAHYRRSDIWKSFLATVMAIPHWFNPFAWMAVRRFEEAAEWACDQAVSENDSLEKTGFARALLSLSTSNPTHLLGASAMATSDLTTRVQRLFLAESQDTLVRRLSLMFLIATIVAFGWINIRLVAGPPSATNPIILASVQDDEPELDQKIETLIGKIDVSDDMAKQFAEVLKTPAGKIAVSNRVSAIEGDMRNKAAEDAIPEFFANLTPDDHNKIKGAVAQAQQDIEQLGAALTGLKTNMSGNSEADQMLTRLLNHENAPQVLYFSRMRQQIRPGRARLMQRLGRFLADDGSGKLVVRESARDQLEKQLRNINEATKHLDFVQQELKSWADEIFEKDELHKFVKERLSEPNVAARVLSISIGRSGMDQQKPAEQYFRFLESILEDGPEGLVIPEEKRAYVEEAIASSKLEREKLAAIRQPIDEIADLIVEKGDSEKLVKDFLKSEIGKCVIAKDFDYRAASAEGVVDQIKASVLEEYDDGLIVREETQEQVLEFVRNTLREARRFRRHTRILDPQIEKLDSEWRATYDSVEGRAVTIEKINELVASKRYDAWPDWINFHFEEVGGKYVVLEDAQAQLQEIVQEAREIEKELEKNDF